MIANYHTHSRWCRHGKGELEDFVQEAIHHGLKEIAFTEHVPHREGFSWLPWEEFPMYDHALNEVKERFKDQIQVIKGFECEYYPEDCDVYRMFIEAYGYEMLILGHHNYGAAHDHSVFRTKPEEDLFIYAEEVCAGLESGLFRFVAHPDCVLEKYTGGWDDAAEQAMRMVFAQCEKLDIPVEINCGGIRSHRAYPSEDAFRLSGEYKLRYLIGSDAHRPQDLNDYAVQAAEDMATRLNLTVTQILK